MPLCFVLTTRAAISSDGSRSKKMMDCRQHHRSTQTRSGAGLIGALSVDSRDDAASVGGLIFWLIHLRFGLMQLRHRDQNWQLQLLLKPEAFADHSLVR